LDRPRAEQLAHLLFRSDLIHHKGRTMDHLSTGICLLAALGVAGSLRLIPLVIEALVAVCKVLQTPCGRFVSRPLALYSSQGRKLKVHFLDLQSSGVGLVFEGCRRPWPLRAAAIRSGAICEGRRLAGEAAAFRSAATCGQSKRTAIAARDERQRETQGLTRQSSSTGSVAAAHMATAFGRSPTGAESGREFAPGDHFGSPRPCTGRGKTPSASERDDRGHR
jgi:hypothetical protein